MPTISVSEQGKQRINDELEDVTKILHKEWYHSDPELVNIAISILKFTDSQRGKNLLKKAKNLMDKEEASYAGIYEAVEISLREWQKIGISRASVTAALDAGLKQDYGCFGDDTYGADF